MSKGYFITLEGIEGAGKSTHLQRIATYLTQHVTAPVITTREPGGTPIAEAIRAVLLSQQAETMQPDTELLLMFAARAQHIAQVIKPALQKGAWIICDRFTDASYAYQGFGRGMAKERITLLEKWVQAELKPNLTFIFDIPVELALQRVRARAADRIEQEQQPFFERVRQGYLHQAEQEPQRCRLLNATKMVEEVQAQWQPILERILHEH